MESILAIGVGLVLRVVVDVATDNDDRVGGVLVGLWEGVVLNHFVQRMPRSFDPYLGLGFRIFVDFLFTQSISRLALVALWALIGMLLADIAPNVWHDSGLRHLYRQVRKDVRHAKRAVPRIRIENDLPSVRLFNRSHSTPSVTRSIRSDRAAPSRSAAPSPAPTPGPARRPGRSPPGTFPDVSGWSETATDISSLRARTITPLGPSPALIPSRERARTITSSGPSPVLIPSREQAAYERIDATHVATSQIHTTITQNTTFAITQTQAQTQTQMQTQAQKETPRETVVGAATVGAAAAALMSVEPIDDPLRLNLPPMSDDWVDVSHPTPAQPNEPVAPFQPDPDSTPEDKPGPSVVSPSRSASVFAPPPATGVRHDTPIVDLGDRTSHPPDQIPLPDSRAASVIGGMYDQPQPRSALHDSLRARVDKATSELGVDRAKSLAPTVPKQSTKSQSTFSWTGFFGRPKHSVDAGAEPPEPPEPPPKETSRELADQGKLDVGSIVQGPEPQIPTPTQVDPPANILSQSGDASPLLLAQVTPEAEKKQERLEGSKSDRAPTPAGVDSSPAPPRGEADKGDAAGPSKTSLFDLPSPTRSPPPPFTEFAGVPEDPVAEESVAREDPVTQDEAPTALTEEQRVAEEKRDAFLSNQVKELEKSLADLQRKLEKEDDPDARAAKAIESDIEDAQKTLSDIKTRRGKKKFSEAIPDRTAQEISLSNKSATEVEFAVTSAILKALVERDDAEPITIQFLIGKPKAAAAKKKANEAKDVLVALVKRHNFLMRSETGGTFNVTF